MSHKLSPEQQKTLDKSIFYGGRVGQVMSFLSLGNDAGITQPTTKSWFSALEATYICFSLEPWE